MEEQAQDSPHERNVHAAAAQNTLGKGLFRRGGRRLRVDDLANGGEDLLAVRGGHPAEVTDLVEAVRQDMGQKAAGEQRSGDGFGLLDVLL